MTEKTEKYEHYKIPLDRPITLEDIKAVPKWDIETRGYMWAMWDEQNETEADRERSQEIGRQALAELNEEARQREARKKRGE